MNVIRDALNQAARCEFHVALMIVPQDIYYKILNMGIIDLYDFYNKYFVVPAGN